MIVKCDVVDCIYNEHEKCAAGVVEIVLTHDEQSKNEYIDCGTYMAKGAIEDEQELAICGDCEKIKKGRSGKC